jgi:hypothetical protein
MNVQGYDGVMGEIVDALQDHGDPDKIRRIQVTEAEMNEIVKSGAFRKTAGTYYGSSDVYVFSDIEADSSGNIYSMRLSGVLICLGPWEPSGALAAVVYGPLTETLKAETVFVREVNGQKYMLAGTGNPANDFVIGKNANIELGIAVRKYNNADYFGDGAGTFDVELDAGERWTFALTAGSVLEGVPNFTEMYDVSLYIDVDPTGVVAPIKWDLQWTPNSTGKGNNFTWYNQGIRVVDDSATNELHNVTQMIQQYTFPYIDHAIPLGVERTEDGVPLGIFSLKLEARPRLQTGDAVSVEVLANITKKL